MSQALVYLMVAVTVFSGANYAAGYLRGRRLAVPRVGSASTVEARPSLG